MRLVEGRSGYLIKAVICLVFGGVFILLPGYVSGAAGLIVGILLAGRGVTDLIACLAMDKTDFRRRFLLPGALMELLAGTLFIIIPHAFMALLAIIAGLFIIATGTAKLMASMVIEGGKYRLFSMIISMLEVLLGVVILINPFGGVEAIIVLFGIGLLIGGGQNLASFIRNDPIRF